MTIPQLMNCPHKEDGHCLVCTAADYERYEALRAENKRLRAALKTWLELTDDLPNEMWLAQARSETRAALRSEGGGE